MIMRKLTDETRILECNPLRSSGDLQSAMTFGQDVLGIFRGREVLVIWSMAEAGMKAGGLSRLKWWNSSWSRSQSGAGCRQWVEVKANRNASTNVYPSGLLFWHGISLSQLLAIFKITLSLRAKRVSSQLANYGIHPANHFGQHSFVHVNFNLTADHGLTMAGE
ncbi:hypothetical protein AVEN_169190-1 [Araneus ventricosus]|uniref:Uncharacterized protein n=1 Tax=Araneus ventricosus TaxID=182803 RepID=A0A4Y2QJL5_ARAVE|nr:hypothetical protein AVEN_169190-1 [Araneus ventricosus]